MKNYAIRIDVWSDFVCPFCYLEEPVLNRIQEEFGDSVEIVWRAFELRPEPIPALDPKGDYLNEIWTRAVYPMARERGMNLKLPPIQPRSRMAHETAAFARVRGKAKEVSHALFRAFFEDHEDIGQPDVLLRLVDAAGLNASDLGHALALGTYRKEVLADERLAQTLEVSGVPAMTVRARDENVENAVLLEGAQPYDLVLQVLDQFLAKH